MVPVLSAALFFAIASQQPAHGLVLMDMKVGIPRRSFVARQAVVLGTPFLANAQSDQQFGEVGQLQSAP